MSGVSGIPEENTFSREENDNCHKDKCLRTPPRLIFTQAHNINVTKFQERYPLSQSSQFYS